MNGEPLDLDLLERTCADCCETVGEVIAECRALRAENDDLSAIHDDLSEDTARLRAEVERLTRELREGQQTVIKARFYPDVDEPPLILEVDPDD